MEPRDYGPYPYVPINDRPTLSWPNGARLAVWIIPNIEFFPLTVGIAGSVYNSHAPVPSVRAWAQRDYGNRVGIWRIMEVLQKHGVSASPTMNSDICDHHPQIVRACVELGWEILGHNETNSRWLNQMEPDEERQSIAPRAGQDRGAVRQKADRLARRGSRRDLEHARQSGRAGSSTSPTGSATTSRFSWISAAASSSRSPIPTRSTIRRFCRRATTRSTNSSRR